MRSEAHSRGFIEAHNQWRNEAVFGPLVKALGPLFSAKSSLQAYPEITLNCMIFLHAIFKEY